MIDLHETFEKHNDEFLKFERVEKPRTTRRDLHAFLLLDEIVKYDDDRAVVTILAAAEHDEVLLDIDCNRLAECVTEAQLIELIRCGVRYSADLDSLCLFV